MTFKAFESKSRQIHSTHFGGPNSGKDLNELPISGILGPFILKISVGLHIVKG